jgi:hypothetical protein
MQRISKEETVMKKQYCESCGKLYNEAEYLVGQCNDCDPREKAERKLDDNTIEALRKHIKTLQAENKQLKAQVARMREALRKAGEAIKAAWGDGSTNAAMDKASEALAAIDKAIGG